MKKFGSDTILINVCYLNLGHDYYGRSNAADSLLIWTHSMRGMKFHDNFVPAGCQDSTKFSDGGVPAVTLAAGLTWMDVYAAASVDRDLVISHIYIVSLFIFINNYTFIISFSFPENNV